MIWDSGNVNAREATVECAFDWSSRIYFSCEKICTENSARTNEAVVAICTTLVTVLKVYVMSPLEV